MFCAPVGNIALNVVKSSGVSLISFVTITFPTFASVFTHNFDVSVGAVVLE